MKTSKYTTKHYIVEEYENLCNGRYVPNNKYRFLYGKSEVVPLADAMGMLSMDLNASYLLVGHDLKGDMEIMNQFIPGLHEWRRQDTLHMFKALYPGKPCSLSNMSKLLGIRCAHFHNAGNDAHCTLEAFMNMIHVEREISAFVLDPNSRPY